MIRGRIDQAKTRENGKGHQVEVTEKQNHRARQSLVHSGNCRWSQTELREPLGIAENEVSEVGRVVKEASLQIRDQGKLRHE